VLGSISGVYGLSLRDKKLSVFVRFRAPLEMTFLELLYVYLSGPNSRLVSQTLVCGFTTLPNAFVGKLCPWKLLPA
jgi:hypothetical protein